MRGGHMFSDCVECLGAVRKSQRTLGSESAVTSNILNPMANSRKLELLLIILVSSSNCNECPAGALRLVSCFSVVMFEVLHSLRCNYFAIISYKVFQIALTLALCTCRLGPSANHLTTSSPHAECQFNVQRLVGYRTQRPAC